MNQSTLTHIDSETLQRLDSGCYVQIRKQQECCWVEINAKTDKGFSGLVHKELSEPGCSTSAKNDTEVTFHSEQIIDLGCDRFCWC